MEQLLARIIHEKLWKAKKTQSKHFILTQLCNSQLFPLKLLKILKFLSSPHAVLSRTFICRLQKKRFRGFSGMTAKIKLKINPLPPIFCGSSKAFINDPVICNIYKQRNFDVKQSERRFNRPPLHQVIQMTIN